MAIKYGRGGFRQDAVGETMETSGWARRPLDPKRRLLYIYVGVFLFLIALLVFHELGLQNSLALSAPQEGTGTVVDKLSLAGRYVVTVQIEVPESDAPDAPTRALRGDVRVPKDSYDRVKAGDSLKVTYQLNQKRSAVVIRSLSQLPPEGAAPGDETAPQGSHQLPGQPHLGYL